MTSYRFLYCKSGTWTCGARGFDTKTCCDFVPLVVPQVRYVDLWSELIDTMESHLDAVRLGLPLLSPQRNQVDQLTSTLAFTN